MQDRLARFDEVPDDLDGSEDGPPDATGEAHDLAVAVADGADAVECPLDPGAVVLAEGADVVDHVADVLGRDLAVQQDLLAAAAEARLRAAAQVHDHLDDIRHLRQGPHALADSRRERHEQRLQVVAGGGADGSGHGASPGWRGHQTAGTSDGSATRTSASLMSRETEAMVSSPCSSKRRSTGDS